MIIKKIFVQEFTDESVGIHGSTTIIFNEDYIFDSRNSRNKNEAEAELEQFRNKLKEAFEIIFDTPQITFDFEASGGYKEKLKEGE